MKKPIAIVTDHAVVRYLERVCGTDIETLRREIGRKVDRALEMEASAVVIDGHRYALRDGYVTTVTPVARPNLATGRQRRERAE